MDLAETPAPHRSVNWSVEQQRMLGAMGFQLLARATPGDTQRAVADAPTLAVQPVSVPGSGEANDHAALRRAISRASGGRDITGLVDDLSRLRREPALKRALWLRLRTLRRTP